MLLIQTFHTPPSFPPSETLRASCGTLRARAEHTLIMLSARSQHALSMLSARSQHAVSMLLARNRHRTSMPSACYQVTLSTLSTRSLDVLSTLSQNAHGTYAERTLTELLRCDQLESVDLPR